MDTTQQALQQAREALVSCRANLDPFDIDIGPKLAFERAGWAIESIDAALGGIAGDAAPQEQPHVSFVDGDSERAIEKWLSTIDPVAEADTEDQSHLAGGASQSVREQAVAYWECRSFDIEHGVWFPWGRVEGSARYPLEQRLADIRAKIAEGSRWELRALYASSLPAPSGLLDRVKAAEQRVQDNRAPRSIPADARDVDLVLAEVRYWLEGNWPPFWIKDAALHQAHQKEGA